MELKLSPISSRGLSPPDFVSDPEDLEVSDEDDDDRNHKHRRQETQTQSLEKNESKRFSSRYRKCNRPFENGHSFRQVDPLSRHSLDKEFPSNFGKRRATSVNISRSLSELQKMNGNKQFFADIGYGRGRLRESVSWGPRNPMFPMVDIAPPLMHRGSIRPAMFAGRGMHNVSNTQSAPWGGGFGLLPRIPNGVLDMVHPVGLQGSLGPPLNPSVGMAVPRQQCRDFEERGFCLRGDMCPMEHGINHIVVEDVQSLSQFNLPLSLPSAHVLGQAGSRVASSVDASSSALISSKGPHGQSSKSVGDEEGYTLDGAHSGALDVSGPDVYDPDQPLWRTDCPETSSLPSPIDAAECLMDAVSSDRRVQNSGSTVGQQSTSSTVWEKVNASKKRSFLLEKPDSMLNSSNLTREKHDVSTGSQLTMPHSRKRVKAGVYVDSCSRPPGDTGCGFRRPAQKASALTTLFVNGIPLKDNKREALLSHFKKFGEVISIYIPSNSERSFVQFSQRKDAERALKSPDAVMGNRFIKLWWANRDNVVDDRTAAESIESGTHHPKSDVSSTYPAAMKSKDNSQATATKVNTANASDNPRVDESRDPQLQIPVGSRAPVSLSKKLDSLDSLKEQIRKKQEMLEQKRNEFRQQLEKLQKQAPGVKGDTLAAMETAKLLRLVSSADQVNAETDELLYNSQTAGNAVCSGSIPIMEEISNPKQEAHSAGHFGGPFSINRYKLDNRPTSFTVDGLVPADHANVNALREHFASFGDLSNVELEDSRVPNSVGDDNGSSKTSQNVSARVSYKTRVAAERAFSNGKTWNGRLLKFAWMMLPANSSGSRSENGPCPEGLSGRGNSSTLMKETPGVEMQSESEGNSVSDDFQSVKSESGNSPFESVSLSGEAPCKNNTSCRSREGDGPGKLSVSRMRSGKRG